MANVIATPTMKPNPRSLAVVSLFAVLLTSAVGPSHSVRT